jgi:hypothetical protein
MYIFIYILSTILPTYLLYMFTHFFIVCSLVYIFILHYFIIILLKSLLFIYLFIGAKIIND